MIGHTHTCGGCVCVHQEAAKETEKGEEELKGLAVSVLRAYMAFELSRNTREKVEAAEGGARAAVAVAAVLNAALEHEPPLPHEVFLSLSLSLSRARALSLSHARERGR